MALALSLALPLGPRPAGAIVTRLLASQAPAAAAPSVVTGSASAITKTAATLNATVNPSGLEVTECKFEYGTTTAYGSSAPCASPPGSGESPVEVSASITGLNADTKYHFRIVATNSEGPSSGSDETFKTLPDAPTVVTGSASSVAQTTVTLNATVNPNGAKVTACTFEYGPTSSYGSFMACASLPPGSGTSPLPVSAAVSGLSANATYHFKIVATNSEGTSSGLDQELQTLPNPPTVLTGEASAVGAESASLNATVNPNGVEVTECKFEYGTTTSYDSSAPCASLPGSGEGPVPVSAAIGGLSANSPYHFRIVATSSAGPSAGSDAAFSTLPNPPTVGTGTATSATQASATLNGAVNPNGGDVSECRFEYGTSVAYGAAVPCSALPGGGNASVAVTASIAALQAGTTYHFRVVARNSGGESAGADNTFATLAGAPKHTPRSEFAGHASFNTKNGAIAVAVTVSDPGLFTWIATFPNGKFGVFAARAAKCKAGQVRLRGRCRPARIAFGKGSKTVAAAGPVAFTIKPSRSAAKALKTTLKRKRGVPVALRITFRSSLGAAAVSHAVVLTVRLRR